MTSLSVLLVEDDAATVDLVASALRPWADELRVLGSAGEALEEHASVDIALVDVGVQQGAGMALMHFLRARDPSLAIVALTPAGDAEAELVANALGVNTTLPRPLTGDALLMAMSPVRERKAARLTAGARARVGPLEPLLAAAEPRALAHALAVAASALLGAPARAVLEDPRDGEIVVRADNGAVLPPDNGIPAASGPEEALPLVAHDEALGTLCVPRASLEHIPTETRAALEVYAHTAATVGVLLRRVDAIARVGIKDPDTSAYTFSYFVDVAGREVERARRYGRKFALITFIIDDWADLSAATSPEGLREARRELVDTILDSVRDSDVLAHVEDDELYLLVPETGMLGALTCRRRIAERQGRRAELARLEGKAAIQVTIGVATYPRDGRDLTSLLKAAHKRGNAARGGIAGAVLRETNGGLEAVLGALLRFRPDEGSWQLRQAAFPSAVVAAMAGAAAREAARGEAVRDGVMYILGERGHPLVRGAIEAVRLASRGGTPAYWLRPASNEGHGEGSAPGVRTTPVEIEVDGGRAGPFALLVVLTEAWAYACVASQHGEYKRVMHSCELELVEALVALLQTTFHLQRGIE